MENEENNTENNESKNLFKIEFNGQNLKNNKLFKKWQNEMKKIYGNDAVLFKCQEDEIYFYASKVECKKIPMYKQICPICNFTICYYCSRHIKDNCDNGKCCISRRFYCAINQDGFVFFNNKADYDTFFRVNFYIFLLPILSFIYFIGVVSACFYYRLRIYDKKKNEFIYTYESRIKYNTFIFGIVLIFNVLFAIMLSIPYIVFDFYIKILIFIISLFTKFYPVIYYLSLINEMKMVL